MSEIECDVCGRLIGYTAGSLYHEAYCPECYEQLERRHTDWVHKHPTEAFAMAQQVLDAMSGGKTGLEVSFA